MGNIHKRDAYSNFVNKIGIFAGSFLVTAMAVYFYSPVFSSNADETSTFKVSVRNREVVSLALDKNNLSFSLNPTAAGSFSSGSVTATVNTNSTAGYELYFSSVDDATNMTHVASSVSDVIASDFSGTVTSSTMANNKWGYSLDNTAFSKIPTATEQARLKDLDHLPTTAEKSTDVYVGVKVGTDLKSGKYSKSVKFSAIAHERQRTMQDFSCSELQNVGDTDILVDARDGDSYSVAKLADGQCWMTDNLRISSGQLNSETSDLPEGTTYNLSAYNYVDSQIGKKVTYYSADVANAGWTKSNWTPKGAVSPGSVCPKNWRMPNGGENGDFAGLISYYDTVDKLRNQPVNMDTRYSHIFSGTIQEAGEFGFWAGNAYGYTGYSDWGNAINMLLIRGSLIRDTHEFNDSYRYSVRCIARN